MNVHPTISAQEINKSKVNKYAEKFKYKYKSNLLTLAF